MGISVRIPTPLRKVTGGLSQVPVEAQTVAEMIENLEKNYQGIKDRLCDEDGKVRRFVNIYVNDEDIRFLQNLETKLNDGDEVSIVPAIAGGAEKIKKKFYLTYPPELVKEPVIYWVSQKFNVITNIRGASVSDVMGLVTLELEGKPEDIERAIHYLTRKKIKVEPIEMNVIE